MSARRFKTRSGLMEELHLKDRQAGRARRTFLWFKKTQNKRKKAREDKIKTGMW